MKANKKKVKKKVIEFKKYIFTQVRYLATRLPHGISALAARLESYTSPFGVRIPEPSPQLGFDLA